MRWTSPKSIWLPVILLAMIAGIFHGPVVPAQAAGDVGYRDFSFRGSDVVAPTSEKPQSKLWFNDGIWWGSLFNPAAGTYPIHRFNWETQTWSDTGVLIDERSSSKADTLWDGSHLFIASAGHDTTLSSHAARVMRYSYDASAKRYTLDAGFPVVVTLAGVEAIVLDKDTTGQLWVAYTYNNQVYVNHSSSDTAVWGSPYVPPVGGTTVSADDIAAVIAYRGYIGVMWSNQVDDTIYFTAHRDGAADNVWVSSRAALRGTKEADDHLNLKSLQTDSSGQIFAAVKSSRNDDANADPNAPLIRLLVLRTDQSWGAYVFGRVSDDHTRPIVMIDDEHRQLYMFATAGVTGGTIYVKQTSLDNIVFAAGRGTPFIQTSADTQINNATSTKQNLNSASGLLVLASDDTSGYYLHNAISLGTVTRDQHTNRHTVPDGESCDADENRCTSDADENVRTANGNENGRAPNGNENDGTADCHQNSNGKGPFNQVADSLQHAQQQPQRFRYRADHDR